MHIPILTYESRIFLVNVWPDDIMSEMKPRPQARLPKREDIMSQEELQRGRKMEIVIGDDNLFSPTSLFNQQGEGGTTSFSGRDMPEWFRKEQESLGIKMEECFQARKELLLGYTELTVEDINNVVDYKTDPLFTGYNRYLTKIQRPFSKYEMVDQDD